MKYLNYEVTFREFPDEISLCINITNCPYICNCCHSPKLRDDIGTELTFEELNKLIKSNEGITCIGFMGGDSTPETVNEFAKYIYKTYPKLKIGWYSGNNELSPKIEIKWFNYIKLGPYIKGFGPLDNVNTNQKMYEVIDNKLIDITYKFHKK